VSDLPEWRGGRLCIVMMSAIGDAVHVLPVANALKRHAPGTHITWVLERGPAELVRGHPAVDRVVLFNKRAGWRAVRDLRRELAEPFDLVLALQVYIKAGVVTAALRSPVKLGFDRARARDLNWLFTTHRIAPHEPQHVQDQYFEFLAAIGVPHEPVEWRIGPWPGEAPPSMAGITSDRPLAALAPASSDARRQWPAERWARVAEVLWEEHAMAPVLIGGGSRHELELEAEIRSHAASPIGSNLGAPLREMVAVIDRSALVVSVNSAPLHIAVALNRPVISLLGHWNPKRTGPYRRFRELWCDGYGDPGEDYPVSIRRRPGTMLRIPVAGVLERIALWSERYGSDWRRPADSWE
jgi:heptosyltransferase I